jgi:hypothetical protein
MVYPTIFARGVVAWRGRTYSIDRHGRLIEPSADKTSLRRAARW